MTTRVARGWLAGLALLALLACVSPARAADGALDRGFGDAGRVVTDLGAYDTAAAVAIAPDGKIVVAGTRFDTSVATRDIVVARYTRDGALDRGFGRGGIVRLDLGDNDSVSDMVVQPDGRIVLAGDISDQSALLVRLDAGGALDPSFGTGGIQTADPGIAHAIALAPGGAIVTAGARDDRFVVARFDAHGALDTSFGSGGTRIAPFGTLRDAADAIAVMPDGRIVAAGLTQTEPVLVRFQQTYDLAIARFTSDGALDPFFSGDGMATFGVHGVSESANDVAIRPDGKLVAAGGWGQSDELVTRFDPAGSLDPSFGDGGSRVLKLTGGVGGSASAVAVDRAGKVLVTTASSFTVMRLLPGGGLDPAFAGHGLRTIPFDGVAEAADVAIQPDCKIVVAGDLGVDLALVRYESACGGASGSSARPRTAISVRGVQRLGSGVAVGVTCARVPCRATARAQVVLTTAGGGARRFAVPRAQRTVARAGVHATLRVRLPRAARAAISSALAGYGRATVRLRISIARPGARPVIRHRSVRLAP